MEISSTPPSQNGSMKRCLSSLSPPSPPPIYKECMKNHAASAGGHAIDGCCEFMCSPSSLTCAACGCHRNFHRKESSLHRTTNSESPPPISSSYYPNSVLFSLPPPRCETTPFGRKRIRTKFSQDQKDKMLGFAEQIGWKMQRGIEDKINKFCAEIGVERGVFKVWMHNHKNTSSFPRDLNLDFGNNGDQIGVLSSS